MPRIRSSLVTRIDSSRLQTAAMTAPTTEPSHRSPQFEVAGLPQGWRAGQRLFRGVHADHQRIALSAAWVGAFVLVAKMAAAARDVAIAWRYGVSDLVDAYQLASTLVFWLPITLLSTLTVVVVPMLVRLRQHDAAHRELFLRELQGTAILLGLVLAVSSLLFGQVFLPYLTDKLSPSSRALAWQMTVALAPLAMVSLVIGVSAARLMAHERQINTLLEAIPAAAILLCVLLWPSGAALAPLLWGTGIGIIAHGVWSWRLAAQVDGASATPRFSHCSSQWPEFYRAVGIMAVGQVVMSLITPLDQYSAAQHGDAAIATLGYANRLIGLFLGAGAMAFARAALPVMSDLEATGQSERAEDMSLKWALLMLAGGLAIAMLAWVLAPVAIGVLFEHGAFTRQDTGLVSGVFRWGVIQVPFYFVGLVLVQLLASRGHYGAISLFAASNFIVKLVLNISLSPRFGIAGIALATSLTYVWSAGCLWCFVMRRRLKP
jgi:putative peptidoglycan lipid II flippase